MARRRKNAILESSDKDGEPFNPSETNPTLSQQSNRVEDDESPLEDSEFFNEDLPIAATTVDTTTATLQAFVLDELPKQPILQTIKPLQTKMKGEIVVPKSAKLNKQALSYIDTANKSISLLQQELHLQRSYGDNLRTEVETVIKTMQANIVKFHGKISGALQNAAAHSKKETEAADKVKIWDKSISAANTEIAALKRQLSTAHKNNAELKEKLKSANGNKSTGGRGLQVSA
jgi:hypothetical protein